MKLTLAHGFRPRKLNLSGDAKTRRKGPRARLAPPEVPRGVSERIVPFGPARRKAADLVASRSTVPWLGDQLDLGKQGIQSDRLQKTVLRFESVENGGVPHKLAGMGAGIGVKQELVRIESMSRLRLVRAVRAEDIERSGADVGPMAVEDFIGVFREFEPLDLAAALAIEGADFDPHRVG